MVTSQGAGHAEVLLLMASEGGAPELTQARRRGSVSQNPAHAERERHQCHTAFETVGDTVTLNHV